MELTESTVQALAVGGAVLGGGGGGALSEGLEVGKLALASGTPKLIELKELQPEDVVVTVAAVGAPAAKEAHVEPADYVRAVELLLELLDEPVAGLITNEMGGVASVNGLLQSALLGLPVVDAPCNGRAHPISLMGAMGLHGLDGYRSVQAACGGDPARGRRVELVVMGDLDRCSRLVREASVQAGGVVAVARNPVTAEYLRENAAVGAMKDAIALGELILEAAPGHEVETQVARKLGGEVVARGRVLTAELATAGGFDVGYIWIEGECELVFWNEYMLLERAGKRLFTFPDLITTFDADSHRPVTSAEIREGMEVVVVATRKENLKLGAGMRDPDLFTRIEEAIARPIVSYVFGKG
ncbi:DUF917 family protein [Candidatus Bipolaricaulota bacterium]|nr:DUF917 family protein [Candidatus Bipolaricaulota bacterium]